MIKQMINKIKNNPLIMNSIILISLSMIVKVLSLLNRIVMTRLLGTDGISLYVLCVPTIMLFTSIGSFSLNVAMSKLVSENLATKSYSIKSILAKGVITGLFSSIVSILILILIAKPLSQILLKNDFTYYPIMFSILFIVISSLNNAIKGFYIGLNKINISSIASLIEETTRIIAIVIIFVFYNTQNQITGVIIAIIAMTIGELLSLLYELVFLNKYLKLNTSVNQIPYKIVISNSLPTLLSRLLGNFTFFLEPIIYTLILTSLNKSQNDITANYGIVNGYILPIITLSSFFSISISTVILPNISKNFALKNINLVRYYTKKSILVCLIPGILLSVLLTLYCKEYMLLIYGTSLGYDLVQKFAFFFIFMYITSPIIAIIQAIGKSKFYLYISLLMSIVKIVLIYLLSIIPTIAFNSLLLSILITSIVSTFIYYFFLKKEIEFHYNKELPLKIIILSAIPLMFGYVLKLLNLHYVIASTLIFLFFLLMFKLTKPLIVDDK